MKTIPKDMMKPAEYVFLGVGMIVGAVYLEPVSWLKDENILSKVSTPAVLDNPYEYRHDQKKLDIIDGVLRGRKPDTSKRTFDI